MHKKLPMLLFCSLLLLLVGGFFALELVQQSTDSRSRANAKTQSIESVQTLLQVTPVIQPAVNLTLSIDTLQSVKAGQTLLLTTYVQVNKPLQRIHFVYTYDSAHFVIDRIQVMGHFPKTNTIQTPEQKQMGEFILDYQSPLAVNRGGNLISLSFRALQATSKSFIGLSHQTTATLRDSSSATIQLPQLLVFPIN